MERLSGSPLHQHKDGKLVQKSLGSREGWQQITQTRLQHCLSPMIHPTGHLPRPLFLNLCGLSHSSYPRSQVEISKVTCLYICSHKTERGNVCLSSKPLSGDRALLPHKLKQQGIHQKQKEDLIPPPSSPHPFQDASLIFDHSLANIMYLHTFMPLLLPFPLPAVYSLLYTMTHSYLFHLVYFSKSFLEGQDSFLNLLHRLITHFLVLEHVICFSSTSYIQLDVVSFFVVIL